MVTDADAAARPDAREGSALRGRAFAALRVAISLAIIAGLIWKLSPGDLADTLRHSDPWLMLLAAVMMIAVQALVIIKWRVLLLARDVRLAGTELVRAYCLGNLLSNVLPTAIGGDVYRVYRVQRNAGARAADVTMSVLYERATGFGAMTCLGALGAAFYYANAGLGLLALVAGAIAAGVLALVLPRVPFPVLRHDHFLRNLIAHRRELVAVYTMLVFSLAIQALNITTLVSRRTVARHPHLVVVLGIRDLGRGDGRAAADHAGRSRRSGVLVLGAGEARGRDGGAGRVGRLRAGDVVCPRECRGPGGGGGGIAPGLAVSRGRANTGERGGRCGSG